ncbi:YraN family protein [Desulfobaculum bizertense]|uniref:UPF0102 protein SAMN02745702_00354 n=1 Tax=Desulfobaculum bizertense DSM 18034 TaxID=1121442 RepID=A0A1T4VI04_9BACT|nr:YraN family protein [Desulfobaculum bizertense]UIJ37880.1 YraN family protein [Desulfobaculum bizertense]SKA64572.1 putative endonuclease [Desulfobaculum bizertense DSM 18034]
MSAWHVSLGKKGEDLAASYLQTSGFTIESRNWHCPSGELDIVCSQGDLMVFVEVKTRTQGPMSDPRAAVNRGKRARLSRAASEYLSSHEAWCRDCRFDVISIVVPKKGGKPQLEHIENAFQLMTAPGSCAWQPW